MQCLILAAGYATRLYPLTENFPKPLLEIGESTILDKLLENACETGKIRRIVVVSNHKFASIFQEWAKKIRDSRELGEISLEIIDDGTSSNETRLGAVRDMELALPSLNEGEEVLVMAGDNLLDFSLNGFMEFAEQKHASCVMTHEENELAKQQKTAIITFDADQRITSYEEKPVEPKGNHAVPPFYCYQWEDLVRVTEALDAGCGKDAPGSFAAWLSERVPLYAYQMPGARWDIGDLESYQKATKENT